MLKRFNKKTRKSKTNVKGFTMQFVRFIIFIEQLLAIVCALLLFINLSQLFCNSAFCLDLIWNSNKKIFL